MGGAVQILVVVAWLLGPIKFWRGSKKYGVGGMGP